MRIKRDESPDAPDAKMEAAARYAIDCGKIDRITGIRRQLLHELGFVNFIRRVDMTAFEAGYDFAMKQRYEELLDENTELHRRLIERDYP